MLIERVEQSDLDACVATLVESHLTYAWEEWAVVGDDRRARMAETFRCDLQPLAMPHGVVTKTGECEAVAVWMPTGAGELLTADERRRSRTGHRRHGSCIAARSEPAELQDVTVIA